MALPTITELRKIARKRSSILRTSESGLIDKAKSQERKLNRYVLDTLLPSFDINAQTNTLKNTNANLKKINRASGLRRFIRKVVNVFMNDYYLNQFDSIGKQTNRYFSEYDPKTGMVNRINNKGATTINGFTNELFDNNQIARAVQDTIRKGITAQSNVTDIKKVLTDQIKGKNDKLGLVSGYHYQNGYNQFQEYARGLDDDFATALKLNYAIYAGGTIKDTRDFCQERNGNVYNRETILSWNETPQNWQGRKPDNNILIDMGGYNCRHDFDWVSYELAKRINPNIEKSKFDK